MRGLPCSHHFGSYSVILLQQLLRAFLRWVVRPQLAAESAGTDSYGWPH